MEYTKDVIFNVNYKDKLGRIILSNKKSKSKILNIIKENKLVITVLCSLVVLISIDIVLVNNFIKLLTTM